MADGTYHPQDDGISQGQKAIRAAVERRFDDIVKDKAAARRQFDRKEQAARFILDGLDGGDWLDVAAQIARRLTEEERVGLLAGVIKSIPDHLTEQVISGMFEPGLPVSSKDHMEAAKFWSESASPAEVRAFVAAGIGVMPPETREAMRVWLNKEAGRE
jgi:hypothetical protein